MSYDLDINFIDPSDNRNVLDYIKDEIERLKRGGAFGSSIKVYEGYREMLISIGAKASK